MNIQGEDKWGGASTLIDDIYFRTWQCRHDVHVRSIAHANHAMQKFLVLPLLQWGVSTALTAYC